MIGFQIRDSKYTVPEYNEYGNLLLVLPVYY